MKRAREESPEAQWCTTRKRKKLSIISPLGYIGKTKEEIYPKFHEQIIYPLETICPRGIRNYFFTRGARWSFIININLLNVTPEEKEKIFFRPEFGYYDDSAEIGWVPIPLHALGYMEQQHMQQKSTMNTTWYESEGQYYIPAEQTTRYQYTFFKEFICPVFREFPQTHKMQWPLHLGIFGRDSKAKRKDLCFQLNWIGDVDFNEENWYQRWKLLFQICSLFNLPFDLFLLLQNSLCSIKPSFQLQESVVPGFYVHNTEESDSEDSIYDPNEGEVMIGGDISPIHSLLDFIRSLPRS